ncbi:hypothetical protein RHS01_09364 [Rhizoctonia solani]|uniref:Uncharacterized protein n=1 Tax=Rhizoctonia solani TaxID=456999 RepID=A0A8H7M1J4_9AGAM|nr:hypothetical protein RHS01_09364 [Rhizoctonia solani]
MRSTPSKPSSSTSRKAHRADRIVAKEEAVVAQWKEQESAAKGGLGKNAKASAKGKGKAVDKPPNKVQKKTVPRCIDSDSKSEEDTTLTPELEAIRAASWSKWPVNLPVKLLKLFSNLRQKVLLRRSAQTQAAQTRPREAQARCQDKEPVSNKTPRATKRAKPDPTPEPEPKPEPELPAVTTQSALLCAQSPPLSLSLSLSPIVNRAQSEPETQPGGYPKPAERAASGFNSQAPEKRSSRRVPVQTRAGRKHTKNVAKALGPREGLRPHK